MNSLDLQLGVIMLVVVMFKKMLLSHIVGCMLHGTFLKTSQVLTLFEFKTQTQNFQMSKYLKNDIFCLQTHKNNK